MGLHAIGIDGAAHGLAVDGQGTVGAAVVFVPLPQGGVELVRAHPDQHVADDRPARRDVPALVEARPEIRQNRLALVLDPLRDLLVAAHAGECRGGGEREHRWQVVPPPLPASRILHLPEVIGQGAHLRSGECHLRNSLVQAGIKVGRPQPAARIPAQWIEKDKLGPVVGDVAAAQAAEAPGVPDTEPVGGAVDRAPVMSRIHERLHEQDFVAKAERPVPHQAPCAQRQHP